MSEVGNPRLSSDGAVPSLPAGERGLGSLRTVQSPVPRYCLAQRKSVDLRCGSRGVLLGVGIRRRVKKKTPDGPSRMEPQPNAEQALPCWLGSSSRLQSPRCGVCPSQAIPWVEWPRRMPQVGYSANVEQTGGNYAQPVLRAHAPSPRAEGNRVPRLARVEDPHRGWKAQGLTRP